MLERFFHRWGQAAPTDGTGGALSRVVRWSTFILTECLLLIAVPLCQEHGRLAWVPLLLGLLVAAGWTWAWARSLGNGPFRVFVRTKAFLPWVFRGIFPLGFLVLWTVLLGSGAGWIEPQGRLARSRELLAQAKREAAIAQELVDAAAKLHGMGNDARLDAESQRLLIAVLDRLDRTSGLPYPVVPWEHIALGLLAGLLLLGLAIALRRFPWMRFGLGGVGICLIARQVLFPFEMKNTVDAKFFTFSPVKERTRCAPVLTMDTLGGFAVAGTHLDPAMDTAAFLDRNRRSLDLPGDSLLALFVVGHVDKRPVVGAAREVLGGNETLGIGRARTVAELLLRHAAHPDMLQGKLVVLSGGAEHFGRVVDDRALRSDRVVRVYRLAIECATDVLPEPHWTERWSLYLKFALEMLAVLSALVAFVGQVIELARGRKGDAERSSTDQEQR